MKDSSKSTYLIVSIWAALVVAHFVMGTVMFLHGPQTGDMYSYSWGFQAVAFALWPLPIWLVILCAVMVTQFVILQLRALMATSCGMTDSCGTPATKIEANMKHQPAISFSNSFHFPFNRAGGRTSNVRQNFMNAKTILLVVGAIVLQASPLLADPAKQISDRDFQIASLLHNIYEFSVQEEKVDQKVSSQGEARSPLDGLPAENLKVSIKALEGLADVPSLRAKLSKDLEELKKSGLGASHPSRRWLELLSRSLDKYSEQKR